MFTAWIQNLLTNQQQKDFWGTRYGLVLICSRNDEVSGLLTAAQVVIQDQY